MTHQWLHASVMRNILHVIAYQAVLFWCYIFVWLISTSPQCEAAQNWNIQFWTSTWKIKTPTLEIFRSPPPPISEIVHFFNDNPKAVSGLSGVIIQFQDRILKKGKPTIIKLNMVKNLLQGYDFGQKSTKYFLKDEEEKGGNHKAG